MKEILLDVKTTPQHIFPLHLLNDYVWSSWKNHTMHDILTALSFYLYKKLISSLGLFMNFDATLNVSTQFHIGKKYHY